jgi:hypothetical protein
LSDTPIVEALQLAGVVGDRRHTAAGVLAEEPADARVRLLGERDLLQVAERRRGDRPGKVAGRRQVARGDRPARALEETLVTVRVELAGERDPAQVVERHVGREAVESLGVAGAGDLGQRTTGPASDELRVRPRRVRVEAHRAEIVDRRVAADRGESVALIGDRRERTARPTQDLVLPV